MSNVTAAFSYQVVPGTVFEFLYGPSTEYSVINFQNGNDHNNIALHFNLRPHDTSTVNGAMRNALIFTGQLMKRMFESRYCLI
jgi:hypothetical protein